LRSAFLFLTACAAVVAAAQAFAAEPVMRVKAKLSAFDGTLMRLEALPAKGAKSGEKSGEDFSVAVTQATRYVGSAPSSFSSIKPGDYVGAAVSEQRGGSLTSQEIYLYADPLRGSGEGRFPEGERLMINGTVTAVKPTAPEDKNDGSLTLHYRGAVLSGAGPNRTVCEGRASPPAYASPLACQADAVIEVKPGAKVSALSVGDKDLLKPGVLVTVAMTKAEDGKKNIGLGVVVEPAEKAPEQLPGAAKNGTVEKPQSSP
jgi:hypothetical protein